MTRHNIQPGDVEALGAVTIETIESPWMIESVTSSDALEQYVKYLQVVSGAFYDAARILHTSQPLFVLTALQREAERASDRARAYHALLLHALKLEGSDP